MCSFRGTNDGFTSCLLVVAAFCVVAVESAGKTLPMGFLERVKDDFNKKYAGGKASTAAAKSLSKSFGYVPKCPLFVYILRGIVFLSVNDTSVDFRPKMKEQMKYCVAHPEEIDKIAKVKAQVSEVKGVMLDNIEKVFLTKISILNFSRVKIGSSTLVI